MCILFSKLSLAGRNYSVSDQELLVIKVAPGGVDTFPGQSGMAFCGMHRTQEFALLSRLFSDY